MTWLAGAMEKLFEKRQIEVTELDLWQFRLFQVANAVGLVALVLALMLVGLVGVILFVVYSVR